jgi:hypothetical protein
VSAPTPQQQLAPLLSGYWNSQALYVAAKLGIADLLKDGPKPVDELARQTSTHAPALFRLLRALASLGIFKEVTPRCFAQTPASELLRADVPATQRPLALMLGEEQYRAWGELLYSVQTGKTAFDKVFGKPIFDYLADHPEQARVFDAAMTSVHGRETPAILEAYDFSGVRVLADIGGGNGSTISGILNAHTNMKGILFDLPGVAKRAGSALAAAGLAARCQVESGSFFETVPAGADAYILRHIIHDWDDESAAKILRTVRAAMNPTARLLVVESVIPPGNDFFFAKFLDLTMLTTPGGKERTEEEYRELYQASGFRLARMVPTKADVSVIEGQPV